MEASYAVGFTTQSDCGFPTVLSLCSHDAIDSYGDAVGNTSLSMVMVHKFCYLIVHELLSFVLLVATMGPLSVVSAVAGLIALVAKIGVHGLKFWETYLDSVFVVFQTLATIENLEAHSRTCIPNRTA